jgi:hypothetical protein
MGGVARKKVAIKLCRVVLFATLAHIMTGNNFTVDIIVSSKLSDKGKGKSRREP